MSKSIIQSIAAIVAAGVWPEIWHPKTGKLDAESIDNLKVFANKMTVFGPVHELDNWIGEGFETVNIKALKIIRKPFSDLVDRVKADPQGNPVTQTWGGGLAEAIDHGDGLGFTSIDFRLSEDHPVIFTVGDTFGIDCRGVHCHRQYFDSLLAAGYPVGIDPDHVIFEGEVK